MGEMVAEIGDMLGGFALAVLPFVAGLAVVAVVALVAVAAWWARPRREEDPVPLIDRCSSDWLGQP